MGYIDVRVTQLLLLKGYHTYINKWKLESVKNLRHRLELKIELFFAVADKINGAVDHLFKGKSDGFV